MNPHAPATPPTRLPPLRPEDPDAVGGYRLFARLGAGGMGRVYLSYTPGGRPIALKVVRPEYAEDAGFRERFAREVANARRIHGLYTAQVVDAGADADVPWLATAYVAGPSLQHIVRAHGTLPVPAVLLLVGGVAEALQEIHRVQVVHRDLKPANVLVAADGPRVIDFGIARAADAVALTGTGLRIGTPAFMAPEQARGRPVTPAADVFALGALAAYAAGGNAPFGDRPDTGQVHRLLHEEPDLRRVPRELHAIIRRCLAKQPEARPTPAEVIDLARTHPAVGGHLGFAETWLPDRIRREIDQRADLPRAPCAASGARPAPAHAPAHVPASGVSGTAPIPAAAPTRVATATAVPAPRVRASRGRRPAATALVVVLSAALGTAVAILALDELAAPDDGAATSAPTPVATTPGPGTAPPSASPPTSPSASPVVAYTAAYTGMVLTTPDGSYDFDIETGAVKPAESARWAIGRGADEFLVPTGSDAAVLHGATPTPDACLDRIGKSPVSGVRFDDVPAGDSFCVRARATGDLAIIRVVNTSADGPITLVVSAYRPTR